MRTITAFFVAAPVVADPVCMNQFFDRCGGTDAGDYNACCPTGSVCVAISSHYSQCQPTDGNYVEAPHGHQYHPHVVHHAQWQGHEAPQPVESNWAPEPEPVVESHDGQWHGHEVPAAPEHGWHNLQDLGGVTDPLAWGRMVNGQYELWSESGSWAPQPVESNWAPEPEPVVESNWAPEPEPVVESNWAPEPVVESNWAPEPVEAGDGGDGDGAEGWHPAPAAPGWTGHAHDLSHINDPLAWGRIVDGHYQLWHETQAGAGTNGWANLEGGHEVPLDAPIPAGWAAVVAPHAPVVYAPQANWAPAPKLTKRERKQQRQEKKAAKRAERKAARKAAKNAHSHGPGWALHTHGDKGEGEGWAAPVQEVPSGWAAPVEEEVETGWAATPEVYEGEWAGAWTAAPAEETAQWAPVTEAPTTQWAAVTAAPTTQWAPVTEAPTTQWAPVTEAPATEAPAQWAPAHHEYDQGLGGADNQWAWGTMNEDGTYTNYASIGAEEPAGGWSGI